MGGTGLGLLVSASTLATHPCPRHTQSRWKVDQPEVDAESESVHHYAYETNLLGERCTAEDIASLVEFLVSEKARFITGQTYVCDGGRSLSMKGTD